MRTNKRSLVRYMIVFGAVILAVLAFAATAWATTDAQSITSTASVGNACAVDTANPPDCAAVDNAEPAPPLEGLKSPVKTDSLIDAPMPGRAEHYPFNWVC